jgi:hypothetical protein
LQQCIQEKVCSFLSSSGWARSDNRELIFGKWRPTWTILIVQPRGGQAIIRGNMPIPSDGTTFSILQLLCRRMDHHLGYLPQEKHMKKWRALASGNTLYIVHSLFTATSYH